MDDIIGARYWYKKSKQYGDELVSFKIDKFWNEETEKPFYKPYVDVLLKKSKLQSKKNYSSIEGYLDDDFFMERWTGTKDINDVKIYDGDIIQIIYDTPYETYVRDVVVMRYGKPYAESDWLDEFYLEERDSSNSFYYFNTSIKNMAIKVIGNVNENPEMYEKLKKGEL